MNVTLLAGETTKFGELWHISPTKMARVAIEGALEKSGLEPNQIDAAFVGNMLSGILGHQENLGSFFADHKGFAHIPAFKLEGACASGALALHSAINSIKAGQYKTVLVLGIEKMTDHEAGDVTEALMAAGSEEERLAGATFPGLYALIANAYMQKYGTTEEELAAVSVKNHYHGSHNPKAQFRKEITVSDVMKSGKIADPLKLLDCSPISDGAAAVIISSDEKLIKKFGKGIAITASEVATDTLSLSHRETMTSLPAAVIAGKKAYTKAGVKPKDIQVAEVHDCFSIAEILAVEDLGFSKRGQGAKDIAAGEYTLGKGKLVVNSSGGLKACGHPVGATGIKQIVEIADQLRGECGERQVKGAKIGLAHNVGGSGAVAVVHILQV